MKPTTIGVVVGRFETPYLHEGHRHMLDTAQSIHDKLCVVLGSHGGNPHSRYPLDVPTRTLMLQGAYPEAIVLSLQDVPDDHTWSENLDRLLTSAFPESSITLYGSRESFIPYYTGILPTTTLSPVEGISATALRENICSQPIDSDDFRKGAIYASTARYPIVYGTVDVLPYRFNYGSMEILLGKKYRDGGGYRLIGGFIDAADESQASAALRELSEEVSGVSPGDPEYAGSCKIQDHRYRMSSDSVITTLFIVEAIGETPRAKDDLDEVAWIPLRNAEALITSQHHHLFVLAMKTLVKRFHSLKKLQS